MSVLLSVRFLLSLAAVCLLPLAAPAQSISEQYLLAAANASRAEHSLLPLHLDDHLALAARLHAAEMARHASISHQFPSEPDLAARAASSGAHFSLITENVAEASNSALIHDLWMNSAGHRANLLDPAVDSVGIAVVQFHGQLYAVEDFARTVLRLPREAQESTVSTLLTAAAPTVTASPGASAARQTCTMQSGYAGTRQPWFIMRFTSSDLSHLPPELLTRLASGKYHQAEIGACTSATRTAFTSYNLAILLFP